MKDSRKKVYIESLGCAKNQVDSEVLYDYISNEYELVSEAKDASLIIVNTCGFIEDAKKESLDTFFSLKKINPEARIIVAGCLAQRYFEDLKNELTEADAVFGNRDLSKIKDVVRNFNSCNPEFAFMRKDDRKKLFGYPGSAYVKIAEGCNHRCSFCAIPLIRGSLRSKSIDDITEEVSGLISSGVKEINLIAQDLTSYGKDVNTDFETLLLHLDKLDGDFSIRLLYLHPDFITDSLINTISACKRVLHYFDIPLQHCNSEMLKKMGRAGNAEKYEQIVKKIKQLMPDSVIRTTLMLGFPTDDEDKFNELVNFVKKCRFTWMGCFVYSREEGTKAFEMLKQGEYKALFSASSKRKEKLISVQEKITSELLSEFIGKTFNVLIEEKIENESLCIGRIYAQAPDVDGLTVVSGTDMECGKVYECRITGVSGIDLRAERI